MKKQNTNTHQLFDALLHTPSAMQLTTELYSPNK